MMDLYDGVLQFHKKYRKTIGDPRNPNIDVDQAFRLKLIDEELQELRDALNGALFPTKLAQQAAVADALGDLVYVVCGSAVTWGIDMLPVVNEIHASNMTKDVPALGTDSTLKVVKGTEYQPPDLERVLVEQIQEFTEHSKSWIAPQGDDPENTGSEYYWPLPTVGLKI